MSMSRWKQNCFSSILCLSLIFKALLVKQKILSYLSLFSTRVLACSKWWNTCSEILNAGFWFSLIMGPFCAAQTFESTSILIRHFQRFLEIGRRYWWWAPPYLFVAAVRLIQARHICTCLNISKRQWWGEKIKRLKPQIRLPRSSYTFFKRQNSKNSLCQLGLHCGQALTRTRTPEYRMFSFSSHCHCHAISN